MPIENYDRVPEEQWRLGPGPVILIGYPKSCRGHVELINKSAGSIEPKAIAITNLPGSEQRLPPAVRVSARLAPHQRLRVPIEMALDPTTPPGTYSAQLSCGSQKEDLVIHVLENWDLQILPHNVNIVGSTERRVAVRIFVTNLGNTEYALYGPVSLCLEHDLEIRRHLDSALRAAGKQGFEKFLDRFVQELSEAAVSEASLHFKPEQATIPPGETRAVELEIELPEDLKQNRVYKGTMKFRNAKVVLELDCTGVREGSPRRQK